MKAGSRLLAFLFVAILAFWFTAENSRELVNVNLFFLRVRASLPLVVFGAMLVGMLAVFLVGLRSDLRTRRMLTRYREVIEGDRPSIPEGGLRRSTIAETTYGDVGSGEASRSAMTEPRETTKPEPRETTKAEPPDEGGSSEVSSPEEGRSDDRTRLDAWT